MDKLDQTAIYLHPMNPKLHTALRIALRAVPHRFRSQALVHGVLGRSDHHGNGVSGSRGRGVCACRARHEVFVAHDLHHEVDCGRAHAAAEAGAVGCVGGVSLQRGNVGLGRIHGAQSPADHGRNLCPQCPLVYANWSAYKPVVGG